MTTPSGEYRLSSETLLPRWRPQFVPTPKPNALDDDAAMPGDPCAGWEIGACEVIRRLSPGSGKVLLAIREDVRDGSTLVVLRRIDVPESLAQELQTHAEWAWRFRHPNLNRVFPCEVSDEGIFWVSERTSGATLSELNDACRKLGKALPVGLSVAAIHDAALALAELHVPSGFSHGLISNQTVAMSFDGTTRLQDVGMFECIARQNTWNEVLETVGPYLAPEQILNGRMPDSKCDVFSLGALLYECLSGQRLLRTSNFDERVKKQGNATYLPLSSLNFSVSKELSDVVARAMSPDRAKRYPNSLELAKALKLTAGSFIWRADARADFVGQLFPNRKRREQELLQGCTPKRSLTQPLLEMPAIQAPVLPALRVAAPRPSLPPLRAKAPLVVPAAVKRTQVRALMLTLVAACLAWVAWSGMVPTDYEQLGPQPSPVVFVAPAPAAEVIAPVESLMCVNEAPPAEVAPAPVVAEEPDTMELVPVKKAPPVSKRKRAAEEEIPDAPWLTPKHGRR